MMRAIATPSEALAALLGATMTRLRPKPFTNSAAYSSERSSEGGMSWILTMPNSFALSRRRETWEREKPSLRATSSWERPSS